MHPLLITHAALVALAASAASAQSFSGLGFLPGEEFSQAAATSADGRVVVGWAGSANGMTAFRWSGFTGMHPLAGLEGSTSSFASGVSNDGSRICGWSILGGYRVATLWGADLQPVSLGLLPGGTWSQALAISEDGATVVGAASAPDGQHAIVWSQGQGITALPDPAGTRAHTALALRGSFVLGAAEAAGGVPVRWTSFQQPTLLELPEGAVGAFAFDIDSSGRAYGGPETFNPFELPTRWTGTADGELSLPSGFMTGSAVATNASGTLIVGRASDYSYTLGYVTGTAVGTTLPFWSYLNQLNIPFPNFTTESPAAVSDDGKVIVGTGWHGGKREAWILKLPGAAAPCPPDVGTTGGIAGQDGHLDNNDFITFINFFFLADPRADIGVVGGVPGHDGRYDNNDFVVFIDQFFTGCP